MGFSPPIAPRELSTRKYILQNKPEAKIAILYRHDDPGSDYLAGVHDGLGDKAAAMIAKEVSYELLRSKLDSQMPR